MMSETSTEKTVETKRQIYIPDYISKPVRFLKKFGVAVIPAAFGLVAGVVSVASGAAVGAALGVAAAAGLGALITGAVTGVLAYGASYIVGIGAAVLGIDKKAPGKLVSQSHLKLAKNVALAGFSFGAFCGAVAGYTLMSSKEAFNASAKVKTIDNAPAQQFAAAKCHTVQFKM